MRASRPRAALMSFGSAFFAAGAGAVCVAWFATLPEEVAEASLPLLIVERLLALPIVLICLAGVLLFGWGTVFFLGQLLFFWRPVLEISPAGILDRASGVSVGFVAWGEIKDVKPYGFGAQRSITIRVENERELLRRQNPVKRLLMKVNRRYFGTGEINIPLNVLAIPDDELAAEIAHYMDLRGEAYEKLRFGSDGGDPVEERSASARTHPVLRITKAVARWTAVAVLSLFYYMVSAGLVLPGAVFLWNGIGPGDSPGWDRPLIGTVMLMLGIPLFVFFPRVVKKLTGREVLSSPYYGT